MSDYEPETMNENELASMRREYGGAPVELDEAPPEPFSLFAQWLDAARKTGGIREPNAMHLSTADERGRPSARMVLLKGMAGRRFIFHTNYRSLKGRQLEVNPHACLVFWWEPLARQVRIQGTVRRLSGRRSDAYFLSRDRGGQLGAWASPQSQEIADYAALLRLFKETERRFADRPMARPSHWGGYALEAQSMEFWQGCANRLHSRVLYVRRETEWTRKCLAP